MSIFNARAATFLIALMLCFGFTAVPAHAATLSEVQISAVLNLLSVFGADLSIITRVSTALHGSIGTVPDSPPPSSAPVARTKRITLVSPNGGESYVAGQETIQVKYRAENLRGKQITATLYSPVSGNTQYKVTGHADRGGCQSDGTCVLKLSLEQAGGPTAGQYRVNLCTSERGMAPVCDSSDTDFTVFPMNNPSGIVFTATPGTYSERYALFLDSKAPGIGDSSRVTMVCHGTINFYIPIGGTNYYPTCTDGLVSKTIGGAQQGRTILIPYGNTVPVSVDFTFTIYKNGFPTGEARMVSVVIPPPGTGGR
ncbi:MAG TPA: hypothetical protein VM103_00125 [Candidatus Paceibacterota bacterium]|nr:hypothetical protein [Candidatus Paceibacterota bacterium]